MGGADSPHLDLASMVVACQGQGDPPGRSLGKYLGMMRQEKCRHLGVESAEGPFEGWVAGAKVVYSCHCERSPLRQDEPVGVDEKGDIVSAEDGP